MKKFSTASHTHLTRALNGTVLFAIAGFCVVFGASLLEFIYFLLAWSAMTGWVRVASGAIPTFDEFPCSTLLMLAFVLSVVASTWIALDRLVMGNLPLSGVAFLFAYSGLPELVAQSQNPISLADAGSSSATAMPYAVEPECPFPTTTSTGMQSAGNGSPIDPSRQPPGISRSPRRR